MRDNLSQRPKLDVPRTGWDRIGEGLALLGVVLQLLLVAVLWFDPPGLTPRHFGLPGEPTAGDGRGGMILLVGISLAVYIGLTLLSRVPHYFSYPWPITERNAAIMYRLARSMVTWLKTVIIWMFLYILWILARMATGDAVDAHPAVILLFLVALHGVVMLFIYRSYRCRHGDTTADPVAVRRPRA